MGELEFGGITIIRVLMSGSSKIIIYIINNIINIHMYSIYVIQVQYHSCRNTKEDSSLIAPPKICLSYVFYLSHGSRLFVSLVAMLVHL